MLFITIFCVWLAILTHRATTQKEAIALVKDAKGQVHFGYEARDWPLPYTEFPSDNTFSPAGDAPGTKWLQNAIGPDFFRSVVSVGLADRQAGSDELIHALTKLPDLYWLDISRLSNLERLDLSLIKTVTGAFLKNADGMTNLDELDVQATGFQGENLRFLAGHPRIRRLTMTKTAVRDVSYRYPSSARCIDIGRVATSGRCRCQDESCTREAFP